MKIVFRLVMVLAVIVFVFTGIYFSGCGDSQSTRDSKNLWQMVFTQKHHRNQSLVYEIWRQVNNYQLKIIDTGTGEMMWLLDLPPRFYEPKGILFTHETLDSRDIVIVFGRYGNGLLWIQGDYPSNIEQVQFWYIKQENEQEGEILQGRFFRNQKLYFVADCFDSTRKLYVTDMPTKQQDFIFSIEPGQTCSISAMQSFDFIPCHSPYALIGVLSGDSFQVFKVQDPQKPETIFNQALEVRLTSWMGLHYCTADSTISSYDQIRINPDNDDLLFTDDLLYCFLLDQGEFHGLNQVKSDYLDDFEITTFVKNLGQEIPKTGQALRWTGINPEQALAILEQNMPEGEWPDDVTRVYVSGGYYYILE